MQTFEERIMPIIQGAKDQGFLAGAASRQAEIDELQKRIDDVLDYFDQDRSISISGYIKLHEILKGEENE